MVYSASGRDSLNVRLYHDVGVAVSGGYNLPSHGYYRGYNPLSEPIPANTLFHARYGFGYQPDTYLGSLYRNVTQGIGIAGCTFYSKELMGNPIIAYVFQTGQLYEFIPNFSIDYNWEFGGSYGWRQSEMIATRANIYINVGLMFSWDISRHWSLSAGPEFSHFSNGDTKYPNGGANLFNLKVGITGHVLPQVKSSDRTAINEYEEELSHESFRERMEYDLVLFGGWRAGKETGMMSQVINEPFPFFGLNLMPQYRLSRHFSAGASLDLIADRSANLYDVVYDRDLKQVVSYSQPGINKQIAAGLSLRGDIRMPIFTIGGGVGAFILPAGNSLRGIYAVFSLKTFMTDSLFLNVSYRLSTKNYTHNMMYGMGVRF